MSTEKKSLFRRLWKGFWEPVLHVALIQWLVAVFMALCIWITYFTSIVKFTNKDVFKRHKNKPAIFVFWHGRSMMLSPVICLRRIRAYAVTSKHKDGRMMAKLQRLFGLRAIYGSTSDGGLSVLRQGVRVLRNGYSICISPDGPGGPSLRVQDGALYFAKMTGAPIIPVCFSSSNGQLQKRWDRYLVARPFGKISCKAGKPFYVDSNASPDEFEKVRHDLEDFMVHQVHEMDAEFGFPMVEQDLTASEYKRKMREERALKKSKKA